MRSGRGVEGKPEGGHVEKRVEVAGKTRGGSPEKREGGAVPALWFVAYLKQVKPDV